MICNAAEPAMEGRWIAVFVLLFVISSIQAGDPDQFESWEVRYLSIGPLGGKPQRVIGINGQFPGPTIKTVTNYNLHIKVTNRLDEPLLFTWNGIQQRKTSWQDGVSGTNCPILPNQTWLYEFQVKDQIGSYFYFPSLNFQRAAGGYGGLQIANRPVILVPFPPPADDFTILIGDWYNRDYKATRNLMDQGQGIGRPSGVLINGKAPQGSGLDFAKFTVEAGKTYRLRISNVGTAQSLNFRIEGHKLLLVETEGSYTSQKSYDSLDVHLGQTYSVLVKADQAPRSYHIVASTKFSSKELRGVGVLQYSGAAQQLSGSVPSGPGSSDVAFSLNQARSIVWNLTAGAARPNPQGSYHYGSINVTRRIQLVNSQGIVNKKQRSGVNGLSYLTPDTPLKLADFFQIAGVYKLGSMPDSPTAAPLRMETSTLSIDYKSFTEIVFINPGSEVQSWHIDGHSVFVVGFGFNDQWAPKSRQGYNLVDAVSRSTVQVYPKGWTAILFTPDNVGFWNIRSQCLRCQYLGQELYFRIFNPERSTRTEALIPKNTILCGKAIGKVIPTQ